MADIHENHQLKFQTLYSQGEYGFDGNPFPNPLALNSQWRVVGSAGSSFQAPTFNQLYFPGFGNPDLQPQRSRSPI